MHKITDDDEIYIDVSIDSADIMIMHRDEDGELVLTCDKDSDAPTGQFSVTMNLDGYKKPILECYGCYIDECNAYDIYGRHEYPLSFAADDDSGDTELIISALEHDSRFIPYEEEDWMTSPVILCISRLYVDPEFRRNGIAKFFLYFLSQFFQNKYYIDVRYACLYVSPDPQNEMSNEEMHSIMVHTIENSGFIHADSTDEPVYFKRYEYPDI